jgi:tetratricopeptide (TPR) repeat protein
LTLEPGQARTVVVRLERRDVVGPVVLRLEGLPRGVVCRPVTVPPGEAGARLELEVDAGAAPAAPATRLVADIADTAHAEAPFPVAVGPARHFKARLAEDSEAVRRTPEDPVAWLNRGHTYREVGFAEEAQADYTKAIRLDAEHQPPYEYAPAYYYRGRACQDMQDAEALRRALTNYDEAIRLDSKSAPAYFQRGLLYQGRGNLEPALKDYGQALELDRDFTAAYRHRAEVLMAMKVYDRALEDYNQALRLDPNSAATYYGRGLAYHLLGQDADAVADYDKALRGPELAVIYYERGNAWRAQKKPAEALKDYDEAIRLDRGFAKAYASRGHLYEEQGDTDRARADLAKARSLREGKK